MPECNEVRLVRDANSAPSEPEASSPKAINVTVELTIDVALLRRQRRALIGIREGSTVSYEQEDAVEGILNVLDFIQDSILDQGLATEEDIFPQLPQLFDSPPLSLLAAD
jgi:hypothetical protein